MKLRDWASLKYIGIPHTAPDGTTAKYNMIERSEACGEGSSTDVSLKYLSSFEEVAVLRRR